jgi:predicted enzyme related to lactoylglutathione lyase
MHSFGHVEIPTTNLKKAKKFFGTVFGWEFQDFPDMEYVIFRTGQQPNGGLALVKKMPRKGQVNVYINVEDINAKLKEIKKARGKVITKREPVGDMGFMAQFETPDECRLSLWEPAAPSAGAPAAMSEPSPTI